MTNHRKMTTRFARRVARMRAICEKLGLKPLSEERAQEIFESQAAQRDDTILTVRARFADCRSITDSARMLGMRRSALFEWLHDAGWLYHDADGIWRATRKATDAEWAVQRGKGAFSWPQITIAGVQEISRRYHANPDIGCAT